MFKRILRFFNKSIGGVPNSVYAPETSSKEINPGPTESSEPVSQNAYQFVCDNCGFNAELPNDYVEGDCFKCPECHVRYVFEGADKPCSHRPPPSLRYRCRERIRMYFLTGLLSAWDHAFWDRVPDSLEDPFMISYCGALLTEAWKMFEKLLTDDVFLNYDNGNFNEGTRGSFADDKKMMLQNFGSWSGFENHYQKVKDVLKDSMRTRYKEWPPAFKEYEEMRPVFFKSENMRVDSEKALSTMISDTARSIVAFLYQRHLGLSGDVVETDFKLIYRDVVRAMWFYSGLAIEKEDLPWNEYKP